MQQIPKWKVGQTQPASYHPKIGFQQQVNVQMRASLTESGYGFSIQNAHGAPLLNITFATEVEAKRAEESVRKFIEHVVDIT